MPRTGQQTLELYNQHLEMAEDYNASRRGFIHRAIIKAEEAKYRLFSDLDGEDFVIYKD